MKNKILFITGLLILFTSLFIVYQRTKASDNIHYHAGFKIYVGDQLQDYSSSEFMEVLECTVDSNHIESAVHLHNNDGDVVHVHGKGMTWGNLIEYVKLSTQNKQLVALVNQQPVVDLTSIHINPNDSLVLFVDSSAETIETNRLNQVSIERISEVEATKEACGV